MNNLKNTYKYLKWRPKKLLNIGLIDTIKYYKKNNKVLDIN